MLIRSLATAILLLGASANLAKPCRPSSMRAYPTEGRRAFSIRRRDMFLPRVFYFFSKSRVASLRNIGRRRFAIFARRPGNETSMHSASSSTSMLAEAI